MKKEKKEMKSQINLGGKENDIRRTITNGN